MTCHKKWPIGYQHTKVSPEKRLGKIAYKSAKEQVELRWCPKCGINIVDMANGHVDCIKCELNERKTSS